MEQHASSSCSPSQQVKPTLMCPRCQRGTLSDLQCKRWCGICGYVESCEDNFLPLEATPRGEYTTPKTG